MLANSIIGWRLFKEISISKSEINVRSLEDKTALLFELILEEGGSVSLGILIEKQKRTYLRRCTFKFFLLLCTDCKWPLMIRSISIILATYLFQVHFNIPDNVLGGRAIMIKKANKVYI